MNADDDIRDLIESERRLTIGQMANLCGLTKKTLRLYHEKGLLTPSIIDDDTGYRYYSLDQIIPIDRISRLQNLGFRLSEVSSMLGSDCDDSRFIRLCEQRYHRVLRDMASLSMVRDQLESFLLERVGGQGPSERSVVCKWMPRRRYVSFELGELSYIASAAFNEAGARTWYCILARAKRYFRSRGVPETALNEISTMISADDLMRRELRVAKVCVFVNEDVALLLDECETLEAGYVLACYASDFLDEHGNYNETISLEKLLRFADEHAMEPCGYYVGMGNVDSPLGADHRAKNHLRFYLPVRKTSG